MRATRAALVRLGRVAVAGLTVTIAGTVAPQAASAAAPAVRITPNTNLADGQVVRAEAAGFPKNTSLELIECQKTYGCASSTAVFFSSGSTGGFKSTYAVTRVFRTNGHTVDCAHTGGCEAVVVNFPNPSVISSWPIAFDPKKPLVPPLAISVSLDGNDGVVVSSGVAVIHGNITCNRAAQLYVSGNITQNTSGSVSQSYGSTQLACTQAQTIRWQLSMNPQTHNFTTGLATVGIYAEGNAGRSYSSSQANGTVVLSAANLPVLVPSSAHVTVPAAGHTVVLHYWVLLSAPSQFAVQFSYSTLNGTASAPTDFVSTSGFITMPAGTTKAIIPITINGTNESPGNRRFVVSVSNPSNAAIGSDNGRGTVTLTHT